MKTITSRCRQPCEPLPQGGEGADAETQLLGVLVLCFVFFPPFFLQGLAWSRIFICICFKNALQLEGWLGPLTWHWAPSPSHMQRERYFFLPFCAASC